MVEFKPQLSCQRGRSCPRTTSCPGVSTCPVQCHPGRDSPRGGHRAPQGSTLLFQQEKLCCSGRGFPGSVLCGSGSAAPQDELSQRCLTPVDVCTRSGAMASMCRRHAPARTPGGLAQPPLLARSRLPALALGLAGGQQLLTHAERGAARATRQTQSFFVLAGGRHAAGRSETTVWNAAAAGFASPPREG